MPGFIQLTADNGNALELTEVTFWDNYWRDSFDNCLASDLKLHLGAVQGHELHNVDNNHGAPDLVAQVPRPSLYAQYTDRSCAA